jgi:hypothetical protein
MILLKRLLNICSHRFSWPRAGTNGQHYQICLRCGLAFVYDWRAMRRTARVLAGDAGLRVHSGTR